MDQFTTTSMFSSASPSATSSQQIDLEGTSIRWTSLGSGSPVLLLHGWGSTLDTFAPLQRDLARHHTVLAIDFPGHGQSTLPPAPWGVADFARSVLMFMDALALERVDLVAHSFGGRVAIKLAAEHGSRVRKLVLVDSAGLPTQRGPAYYVRVGLAKIGKLAGLMGGRVGQALRERIYKRVGSSDYRNAGAMRSTFVRIVNEDLTELLPRIKSPTLLVWGDEDAATPVAAALVMRELIPHAELKLLKNAGHFSYIDQYGIFRLVVAAFLASD